MLTGKQKAILDTIGNLQLFIQGYCDEEYREEISFDFEGHKIVHPLLDESGTVYVDPEAYYGDSFTNSGFMELI